MPAKSSRPGKRGAAGKGFNPYRASDGKFAPGAHKAKPKVAPAKGSAEANLKTGKRYTARAAHWSKKADEAAKAGNAEALKFAQNKAKQAHEKVQKALGEDHELTKQAKAHRDKAHEHASGVKPNGAVGTPSYDEKALYVKAKTELAKLDSPKTSAPISTKDLTSDQAKSAKRYHARAKHWEKKAQEASAKAKNATTEVDRKIAEAAAAHAMKKAEASAKLVEKAAGKDHPLAVEARKSAESAKMHAGVKVAPKQVDAPKSIAGPAKIEKGEYVTHQHGTMKIDHVGGTNVYGTTSEGKALVIPLKAKDQLTASSKDEFEAKKTAHETKQKAEREAAHKAALSVAAGTGMVPNKFSPGGVPGPKYTAAKPSPNTSEMDLSSFGDHSKSIQEKITSAEKAAVLSYSGSGYSEINGGLRKGSVKGATATTVAHLDSAMAKSALPHDTLLYRGAGGGKSIETWSKLKPGDEYQDSGFTSTSVRESSSFASSYGVKLTIKAPKGYPGLAMDSKLSHYSSEKEVLLPRNTRFKVTKIDKTSGGGLDVHVEIVTNHD